MFKKITPKIRVSFWFWSAFLKKHLKILSISFLIGILLLLLIKSIYPSLVPYLTIKRDRTAIIGDFTPSNLPFSIQSLISNGLTSVNLEGSPTAGLSNQWKISEDGKTYTFYLKKGIKWHDDNEFSSQDINYNLKDAIILPNNRYELKVTLNNPYVPLPILLSKPLFKKGLIGVGNYSVKSLKLNGDNIVYLELKPTVSNSARKIFRFYSSEEKAITAFKLGEIDAIEEISDPKALKNWNNINIEQKVLLNRYVAVFFNTKDPLLKDKETRQALALSLPTFYGEKPFGPISPLSWAYYPKVKQYDQNLELAQKRLTDTPLSSSSAKIVLSTFQNLLPIANKIAEIWKSIGIQTEIKIENNLPNDYQILIATQEIPPDPDQYPLWHSTQTMTNITKLSNPKIDKLLEDGRITRDPDERFKIYADFQRFLADECPVAYLYYPRIYKVTRK